MTINTSQKGQTKECACADELTAQGWTIEFRSTRTKFQRIDLGYRPTKEERETCECGKMKKEHVMTCEGASISIGGKTIANYPPERVSLSNDACSKFRMKKLTGWKAAKFDISARKPGVLLLVSCKLDCAHMAEERRNIEDYRKHWELDAKTRTEIWDYHKAQLRGRGKARKMEQAYCEKEAIG